MSLADYFEKNSMAASQVLHQFDNAGFKALLKRVCVAIAIDCDASHSKEAISAADLIIRLIARFYPRIAIIALDTEAKMLTTQLESLAKEINPNITLVTNRQSITHSIVLGNTKFSLPKKDANIFYAGSRGWTALLSQHGPVGAANSVNPFGSGVAACFAVANVFRTVFRKQLPADAEPIRELSFSVIEYKTGKAAKFAQLKTVSIEDTCLVGAGAIGNGVLWALGHARIKGSLTLVDPEDIELSNLQRYILATRQDEFHPKVELAERWLSGKKDFTLIQKKMSWDAYAHKSDWIFDRVAVALDSAKDRIGVQASLPRWIVNAWTQDSAIGISRHPSLERDACLACLYIPNQAVTSEDVLIATSLGLATIPQHPDLMDVRRRLDLNVPNDRAYLERIASIKGMPIAEMLPFENKTLRELYTEGVCGGKVMGLVVNGHETHTEVPMAFQSALAGIFLAAELVIDSLGLRTEPLPTITRLDMLQDIPDYISSRRAKDSSNRCLCQDDDFREVYATKYAVENN